MTRRGRGGLLLGWLLLAIVYTAHVARSERRALESSLRHESAVVHRIVSQRVDQHDAHLTSLAALALSDTAALADLFLDVANAIRQFYPRVVAVDLIELGAEGGAPLITRGEAGTPHDRVLRSLARGVDGPTVVRAPLSPPGRYLLVKRVPSDLSADARFVLALEVDTHRLLQADAEFWRLESTSMALAFPDGGMPGLERPLPSRPGWLRVLSVEATLGSRHPDVALLLDAEAKRTAIELVLALSDETPRIVGDPVALEQIVFNLVRNGMDAMRPHPAERIVRIASAVRSSSIEITVIDSGSGIDPSMEGRLFEPFASDKPGGMGLGLALCERIVERMDGEIEIGDTAGGAIARLRFPRALDARA